MAISMLNDKLVFFPITLKTEVQPPTTPPTFTEVPIPATDTFTVVSSKPGSLAPSFGPDPGGSGVNGAIGTPLVMEDDVTSGGGGITLTVTDSNNDVQFVSDLISISLVPPVDIITGGAPSFSANPNPPTAAAAGGPTTGSGTTSPTGSGATAPTASGATGP